LFVSSSWNSYQTREKKKDDVFFFNHICHPNNDWGVKLMTLKKRLVGGNPLFSYCLFILQVFLFRKKKQKKKKTKKERKGEKMDE